MDIETLLKGCDKKHLNKKLIEEALNYAKEVHKGQKRRSGKDYITHPFEVARVLASIGADEDLIIAALLHDTIEEGKNKEKIEKEIFEKFGSSIYFMVRAMSKDPEITDKDEQYEEYLEQIKKAMEIDISVFLLKTADLLHNLETLDALPKKRREKWIEELKESYLPLFSDYYHQISFHYHDVYMQLMEKLQELIDTCTSKKDA
jgi:GTP pyrophosphokinase